jgi:hypothetical protein
MASSDLQKRPRGRFELIGQTIEKSKGADLRSPSHRALRPGVIADNPAVLAAFPGTGSPRAQ